MPKIPRAGNATSPRCCCNELFGAEILKTPLPEGDHFYNRLGGERLDLTDSQFDAPIVYADLASSREEALSGTSPAKFEALRAAFLAQVLRLAGRSTTFPGL